MAEERQPVVMCKHLYSGKVFEIWAAWQDDEPHNYFLGRSELEARENFAARVKVEIGVAEGGGYVAWSPGKDLEGRGPTKAAAERALMRQINLLSDKLDWREMCFELIAATGAAWRDVGWQEREIQAVQRELSRRTVARVQAGPFPGTDRPALGASHAETPFRPE